MSRFKRIAWIAVPLVIAGGALAYAHQGAWNHGPMGHGGHQVEMHMDHLDAVLTRIHVPDDQKAQVEGILKGAFTDWTSLHETHSAAFGRMHELLLAPSVDRAQIEALRVEQVRLLDEASKRLVAAFGDAAELLSPEQRAALAAEMRRMHGG
ncbi:MAG TPA: periplasmic heavy metal sensor [Steroidobacteraceae bacterium]|nr:periplasmic heavy metal sensor [Steroidobacteraceae bacterium]